jgi:hypothetical protein
MSMTRFNEFKDTAMLRFCLIYELRLNDLSQHHDV